MPTPGIIVLHEPKMPNGKQAIIQGRTTMAPSRSADEDKIAFARKPESIGNISVSEADERRRVPGVAARRPRNLHLRRARQGRHDASGLPQYRAHGRAALRRDARSQAQGQADGADRHRQRRHDARLFQVRRRMSRNRSPAATPSPNGRASATAGSAARRTTRRRFSARSAPMPISTIRIRRTPSAGTSSARSACRSSITPSSIRRSTATARRTKSATCAVMSRRKPTPASSCRARRWWRPARR